MNDDDAYIANNIKAPSFSVCILGLVAALPLRSFAFMTLMLGHFPSRGSITDIPSGLSAQVDCSHLAWIDTLDSLTTKCSASPLVLHFMRGTGPSPSDLVPQEMRKGEKKKRKKCEQILRTHTHQ